MYVDEAGRHHAATGVDRVRCPCKPKIADGGDTTIGDRNIGVDGGRARAIDHSAMSYQ